MKTTLQDIIDQVAEQSGATKKLSEDFIHEFLNVVEEALNKNGIAKIKGLGTFKLSVVEERKSINVRTGEEITIPSHNKIAFAPEKTLKTAINKPYSHMETYTLSKDGPVDPPSVLPVQEEHSDEEEKTVIPVMEENVKVEEAKEIDYRIEEDTNNNEDMEEEEKRSGKWIIIIILLIILGLIAALLWWQPAPVDRFMKNIMTKTEKTSSEDEINEDEILTDDLFNGDTTIIDEASENLYDWVSQNEGTGARTGEGGANYVYPTDSTVATPSRAPEFPGEYLFDKKFDFKLVDFMQANFPNMKLITYGTPREVELKEGSRLTLLSLEYYGSKRFWVYIYMYNTDIIQHPNDIPAGTVVKVPRLDKSLVDPDSQANINAAWDVQKYLLRM